MIDFQFSSYVDPVKEIPEIPCQIYILIKKVMIRDDYEENTSDNEVIRSTILKPFQLESEQKITCGNESHQNETKYIHASAADLLHVGIGNLD